jgi:predicted lipid carrier protein YhbT
MNHPSSYRVPAPIRHVLSRLPKRPGAWLFTLGLNAVLPAHLDTGTRRLLAGKRLRLAVTDAGMVFDFAWQGRAFAPAGAAGTPDLVIAATLHDLGLLATRKEDPDTLFFSRRLVMEGDTELGLLIKNTLDAIDGALLDRLRPRRRTC